jgi:hypothetical protein
MVDVGQIKTYQNDFLLEREKEKGVNPHNHVSERIAAFRDSGLITTYSIYVKHNSTCT